MKRKRNTVIWRKKRTNSGKNGMVGSSALLVYNFKSNLHHSMDLLMIMDCQNKTQSNNNSDNNNKGGKRLIMLLAGLEPRTLGTVREIYLDQADQQQ